VNGDKIKIKLTDPKALKLEIPIKVSGRALRVNFINTGVPHTVIFVEGLDKIDVKALGRQIRFHKKFAPAGTNVNFVEMINKNSIRLRTYERGVEDETLACGTGSVASALIASYMLQAPGSKIMDVHTRSGEILKVYFKEGENKFTDVWLEGKARIVFKGEFIN
jgi:diaminopimelate epimerase